MLGELNKLHPASLDRRLGRRRLHLRCADLHAEFELARPFAPQRTIVAG
jgi:hypothetical protein